MREMRSLMRVAVGGLLTLSVALPAFADNVQPPFGTMNGDIYGRARAPGVPVLWNADSGVQEAWSFNLGGAGLNRPAGSELTFDADGNIYMRTSTASNTVASFSQAGALRWIAANTPGGAMVSFGATFSSTSVIVGDGDLCYAYWEPTAAANARMVGINKATGVIVWNTELTGDVVRNAAHPYGGNSKTPVLYGGKVYVMTESGDGGGALGAGVGVYQIDSATGAIDWNNIVAEVKLSNRGSLTFIPNAFGAGVHGLYHNVDGGNDPGAFPFNEPEVYAVALNTNTNAATIGWTQQGGKAARSHLIYSDPNDTPAGTGKIYQHSWTDYGADFYAYDPATGAKVENQNQANVGHGFYDVGSLDWDNRSVIAGGFSGLIIKYTDTLGDGVTTDADYPFETLWGETRVFGSLLQDCDGNSMLVTGTNSRCTDFSFNARAVMLDITNAQIPEDGPVYLDDIIVEEGPIGGPYNTLFSEDFEGLSLGDLPGQGGWELDNAAPSGVTPAQLINDPNAVQGKVAALDAAGNGSGWQGVYHNYTDSTADEVVIRWKQWRSDLTDNIWPYYGDAVNDFGTNAWHIEWDSNLRVNAYQFAVGGTQSAPLTAGVWEEVVLTYTDINNGDCAQRLVSVSVNGGIPGIVVQDDADTGQSCGAGEVTNSIRGFGFQIEGTPPTSGGSVNQPIFDFTTNICADHGFTTRGGVVAGPDGSVYYTSGNTNTLHRLIPVTPAEPCPAECIRGDSNCDGVVDNGDIDCFVQALLGSGDPGPWQACALASNPSCTYDFVCTNDINGDTSVDNGDIDALVACLLNQPAPGESCPQLP